MLQNFSILKNSVLLKFLLITELWFFITVYRKLTLIININVSRASNQTLMLRIQLWHHIN